MKKSKIDWLAIYFFDNLNVSKHKWLTLNKCLSLFHTSQMLLYHCRKKLAGGMIPSISWSLWVMPTLILEWIANWRALSFLTMGSVTWTARMNTPCQQSWCVTYTLHTLFSGLQVGKWSNSHCTTQQSDPHLVEVVRLFWFEVNRLAFLNSPRPWRFP